MIDCKHWKKCGVVSGGCCKIGEYDKPSYGVCLLVCKKNTSKPEEKVAKEMIKNNKSDCKTCASKGLKRLITGSAKLLKAELGIDACDSNTIIDRRNICESCEDYDFGVCNLCGCFCAAKVKLKSEKCPKGQW